MGKKCESAPSPKIQEKIPGREGIKELEALFEEAERVFETEGRDAAKTHLTGIYNMLMALNKWDRANYFPLQWNKDGDLTEEEFDALNLRRKKLSNAIGIMTANGTIRHDLNKI